jgi:hypothetical protein
VDKDKIVENGSGLLRELIENFPNFPQMAIETFTAFHMFRARARDLGIYGPRLVELSSTLAGRVGAIMGVDHLETIESFLKGRIPDLEWRAYVASLAEDTRRGVLFIETFSEEHLG